MAHRISKEELDEQFEQFLKESLSDDSFGSSKKSSVLETLGRPRQKEMKKKEPSRSPWWITDDDSEDGAVPHKPSSASRSKALDKFSTLEEIHKAKRDAVLDKDDGSSTADSPDSDSSDELLGTNQSFLKSNRTSQPIEEEDEDEHGDKPQHQQTDHVSVSISRDSLETDDSVVASGPNHGGFGIGLDTLEEQEEKENFFARLERGASSTIDYSRLNKELDSADSVQLAALIRNEQNDKTPPDDTKDELKHDEMSGNYSEDFEDEVDDNPSVAAKREENEDEPFGKVPEIFSVKEQREEKPGMLAKVLLLDSLESSMETQKMLEQQIVASMESAAQQGTNEMTGTGISYGQTNSDIEALHRAYHHIDQSMVDTNEQKIPLDVAEDTLASFQDVLNTHENVQKNISTTDSDLPTVEELMKPIRDGPSFARGFDLKPVSLLIETGSSQLDKPEIQLSPEQQQSFTAEQKLREGLLADWHNKVKRSYPRAATNELHGGSNTERFIRDHQVANMQPDISMPQEHQHTPFLLQDKDNHQVSPHPPKLWETYAVSGNQVTFKTKKSSSSLPKKKMGGHYASVRSSGYGKTSSPLKPLAAFGEKQTAIESMRRSNLKSKVTPDQSRQKGTVSAVKSMKSAKSGPAFEDENNLIASARPYIKGSEQRTRMADSHMPSDNMNLVDVSQRIHEQDISFIMPSSTQQELYLQEKIKELDNNWRAEHLMLEHLKVEFSQKGNDLELKMHEMKEQQERELLLLKQENYILQTKLHCGEEKSKKSKKVLEEIQDSVSEEKLKQIQKEIKEQEELLQGYQQENEKLYRQVKELQEQNKKNAEMMFKENQNLLAELATVKEQKTTNHVQQHLEHDSEQVRNQSFTELLSELRAAQRVQTDLLEEIKRLKQDKQSLEVDIGQMRKERDHAKAQIIHTSGDKSYEMKIMEESYKQEILRLNKRLQWFAENQELLDKDAVRLRDASKEIEMLTIEVQKLKTEDGNRSEQQQKRLKDRAADAKRIQDLERQVKEMEGIIKRRHPNSLPALIYAAATASEADSTSSAKPHTTVFLERRIQKLEADLEGKDEEAKKSLRSMEQQFQKIKIQYEQRITELEQLLAYKLANEPQMGQHKTASHIALEQELLNLKEVHQNREANLLREIEMLKNQNAGLDVMNRKIEDKDFLSIEQQVEQANVNARLVRLNQELSIKSKEVQGLSKTVERLQKERMAMLSDKTTNIKADSKQKPSKKGKHEVATTLKGDSETTDPFPRTLDEKVYQPNTFTDIHISEVLQENDKLKNKLERLSASVNQQNTQWQTAVSLAESNLKRVKEETKEHIAALKALHQRQLETILCQHAVEHSSSRVAELSSKNSSQEIFLKHLQDQVNELQRDRESLAVLKIREEILQKEMAKLLEELREAKDSHTPEMKHFLALENKIKHMENRHAQREQELQQMIRQTRYVAEAEQTQEVEKWRKLAHTKNQELEKFRVELDSILDVLRELQRQGVIIPAPSSDPSNLPEIFWKA